MVLHVIEVSEAPITDEIDLFFAGVEDVDRVMSDRLRENKEVLTTRAGQVILARPGKDRRALREDLHVVGGPGEPVAAVGVGPAHRDLERHRARIIGGRGDGEHRDTAGLDRPAAIAVVGALAQGPAGRNAGDCHRYGTQRPRFMGLPETPAGRIWLGINAVRLDSVTPARSTRMSFAAFGPFRPERIQIPDALA